MRFFRYFFIAALVLPLYLFSQENSNNYSAGIFFLYYTEYDTVQFEPFVRAETTQDNSIYGIEYYCSFNRVLEAEDSDNRHTTVHNFLLDNLLYIDNFSFESELGAAAGGYNYNEFHLKGVPGLDFNTFFAKTAFGYTFSAFTLSRHYIHHSTVAEPEAGLRSGSMVFSTHCPVAKLRDERGNYYTADPALRFRNTIKPLFFYSLTAGALLSEQEGIEARGSLTLGVTTVYGDITLAYTLRKALASRIEETPEHLFITGISGSM